MIETIVPRSGSMFGQACWCENGESVWANMKLRLRQFLQRRFLFEADAMWHSRPRLRHGMMGKQTLFTTGKLGKYITSNIAYDLTKGDCFQSVYVCQPIILPVCLSPCLYVCWSASLSICESVSLSANLPACLYVCLSVCMSIYVCMPVYLYVCLSII